MAAVAGPSMEVEQDLPGFRFHPTEEELLDFYLSRVVLGKKLHFHVIGTLNIYRHDPWDLPGMAKIGEREWYFFVPRDRKAGNGGRPNRTTERGFWKATGSDRAIRSSGDPKRVIGLKKTLVFYQGRAPRGTKTDWVMNEYRLPDFAAARATAPPPLKEDMVLCKIYRKATPLKELEQRASAIEEMQRRSSHGDYTAKASLIHDASASTGDDYFSSDDVHDSGLLIPSSSSSAAAAPSGSSKNGGAPREAKEEEADVTVTVASAASLSGLKLPAVSQLPSLQLPANHGVMDWLQDPFLTQLRSPWQDQHCLSPYAHLLYY